MEGIRTWVVSIAASTMIVSIVCAVSPKNSAGKVVSLVGAIIIMISILSPIGKIDVGAFNEYLTVYDVDVMMRADELLKENEKIKSDIIAKETSAYILQRAKEEGLTCAVSVYCQDELPHSVTVEFGDGGGGKRERLSMIIEEECGIPRERQHYKMSGV